MFSAVLQIGENEYRLQFLRAGPSGITTQNLMLTATDLAVSCCRQFSCGGSGAEKEFNEYMLFVLVVKDLQVLLLPWSCILLCLNTTEPLTAKSAVVFFSGNSSASKQRECSPFNICILRGLSLTII